MKRWKMAAIGLGVCCMAGYFGQWMGAGRQQSFAQDAKGETSRSADESPEKDRGWIGLMVENGPDGAIRVADVFPGGPGAFGRIRQGDILLEVAGTKIQSEEQLAKTVEQLKPGQEVAVVVQRDKQKQALKVRVGSLREFHEHYVREMLRRDPRNPNYTKSLGVSQEDLNIEMFRRLFEQNERLERSLLAVRHELGEIRQELKAKKAESR